MAEPPYSETWIVEVGSGVTELMLADDDDDAHELDDDPEAVA